VSAGQDGLVMALLGHPFLFLNGAGTKLLMMKLPENGP
jgi:hypothetical protein